MSDLRPCPRCSRHVEASEPACPFCAGDLAGALPGEVRLVSRRELTRAAIFGAAALWAGACGSSSAPADEPDEDSSGGESDEADTLSHDSDDGSGERGPADTETEAEAEARLREAEEARALEENERRMEDERFRRHRPRCTPEGLCPPYGAPPLPDTLV